MVKHKFNYLQTLLYILLLFISSSCQKPGYSTINNLATHEQKTSQTEANTTQTLPFIEKQVGSKKTIQVPDYTMSITATSDNQWLAISASAPEISKVSGLNRCNILVRDMSNSTKKDWIKLFSDENSLDYCPNLQFSPDGKYLAAVTWSGICFIPTGDWENRECYNRRIWSLPYEWSPDSKGIAVQFIDDNSILFYQEPGGSYSPLLSVEDVFQNGFSPNNDAVYSWGPTWSPDGKKFAFVKYVNNSSNSEELWMEDIGTKEKTKLSQGNFDFPKWSPIGDEIALIGDGLFIYTVNENSLKKMAIEPSFLGSWIVGTKYVWSPSGKEIALNLSVDASTADVFIIDINAGISENLGVGNVDPLCWSREGDLLLYSIGGQEALIINKEAE